MTLSSRFLLKLRRSRAAIWHVCNAWRIGALLAMLVVGCGESELELETWPVHGTVIDQNGVAPSSGVVRFLADRERHQLDPHRITVGPIQSDGSFTAKTHRKSDVYEGAPPGTYDLMVMTDKTGPDGQKVPVQFDVPERCTVESGENKVTVKIQR